MSSYFWLSKKVKSWRKTWIICQLYAMWLVLEQMKIFLMLLNEWFLYSRHSIHEKNTQVKSFGQHVISKFNKFISSTHRLDCKFTNWYGSPDVTFQSSSSSLDLWKINHKSKCWNYAHLWTCRADNSPLNTTLQ